MAASHGWCVSGEPGAQRATRVRCTRLLGGRGPLAPQNNMRGLLRGCNSNALVSQSPQVSPLEESLSPAEQDRCDGNVQLINKAFAKILLDCAGPTANSHVSSSGRLSCPVKRLVNPARDEVKRRVAFHCNGSTRVVSEDEDWNVIRRIVSPPAFPVHVRPGTANRSEHVPPENPCPNIPKATRGEVFVNPRCAAVLAKQGPLQRACREEPVVQICPANAERVAALLLWDSSVSIERDSEALNANSCHPHPQVWTSNVRLQARAALGAPGWKPLLGGTRPDSASLARSAAARSASLTAPAGRHPSPPSPTSPSRCARAWRDRQGSTRRDRRRPRRASSAPRAN